MLFVATFFVHSQVTTVLVNANKPIDESRYEDIKRSPYLFDDFVEAILIDTKARNTVRAKVNYNGYEKEFEFESEGKKYFLDATYYAKISMKNGVLNGAYQDKYMSGDSTVFIKGINPNNHEAHQIALLMSDGLNIIKSYEVDVVERKVEDVGRTIVRKYFAPKFYYFSVKQGQIDQFKLNKKGIQETFNSKAVNDYIKNEKLKLTTDAELMQVIRYFQSLQ